MLTDKKGLIACFAKAGVKRTYHTILKWEREPEFPVFERGHGGNVYDVEAVFKWYFGQVRGTEIFSKLEV